MTSILHFSHTDIRSDSRILKEIEAIRGIESLDVYGIGMDHGSYGARKFVDSKIVAVVVRSRSMRWLPRIVRHFINFIELSFILIRKGLIIRPGVVHCHDTVVLAAGIIVALFVGSRLVYDAHELESQKNGQSSAISRLTLLFERIAWRSIDGFISVSPSIIDWYSEKFGVKPSALILNSPVQYNDENNSGRDLFGKNYLREKYLIPDDAKVYIYVGIIDKGRGVETSLLAFSENSVRSHLVFLGFGGLVPLVVEYAEKFQNIHYHEPVLHSEVVSLSSSADIGLCLIQNVSLSDYYSLPNKLFEYAFAGLHVVSSDFPDIKRVVADHDLGWVCMDNVSALSELISRLENFSLQRTPRNLDDISWSAQAEKLRTFYRRLLRP